MSTIRFKLKSSKDWDEFKFDGFITVAEVRQTIMEQLKLGRKQDFVLTLQNAESKEVYTDDAALIKRSTSMFIVRDPIDNPPPKSVWMSTKQSEEHHLMPLADDDIVDVGKLAMSANLDIVNMPGDENDKIKEVMRQEMIAFNRSALPIPPGTSQTFKISRRKACFKCGDPNHWGNQCPLQVQQKPKPMKCATGIPKSHLVPVSDPQQRGALLTPDGTYVIPELDLKAYQQKKIEKPPFLPKEPPAVEAQPKYDPELLCPICKGLISGAVTISCCAETFCDGCIQNHLIDSDNHECPACHQKGISPAEGLLINRAVRNRITQLKNDSGTAQNVSPASSTISSTSSKVLAEGSVEIKHTIEKDLKVFRQSPNSSGTSNAASPLSGTLDSSFKIAEDCTKKYVKIDPTESVEAPTSSPLLCDVDSSASEKLMDEISQSFIIQESSNADEKPATTSAFSPSSEWMQPLPTSIPTTISHHQPPQNLLPYPIDTSNPPPPFMMVPPPAVMIPPPSVMEAPPTSMLPSGPAHFPYTVHSAATLEMPLCTAGFQTSMSYSPPIHGTEAHPYAQHLPGSMPNVYNSVLPHDTAPSYPMTEPLRMANPPARVYRSRSRSPFVNRRRFSPRRRSPSRSPSPRRYHAQTCSRFSPDRFEFNRRHQGDWESRVDDFCRGRSRRDDRERRGTRGRSPSPAPRRYHDNSFRAEARIVIQTPQSYSPSERSDQENAHREERKRRDDYYRRRHPSSRSRSPGVAHEKEQKKSRGRREEGRRRERSPAANGRSSNHSRQNPCEHVASRSASKKELPEELSVDKYLRDIEQGKTPADVRSVLGEIKKSPIALKPDSSSKKTKSSKKQKEKRRSHRSSDSSSSSDESSEGENRRKRYSKSKKSGSAKTKLAKKNSKKDKVAKKKKKK